MAVPTPGFDSVSAAAAELAPSGEGLVGMVLQTFSGSGSSWFGGPRCSVFLVDSFHVLQHVVVPAGAGAGRSRGMAVGPQPSTAALLAKLELAMTGESVMPSPADPKEGWGSKVLVKYLPGGIPFIADYLPHPALQAKRTPVLATQTTASETASTVATARLRAEIDEVPDELSDADAVQVPTVPRTFGRSDEQTAAWKAAYVQGWLDGAARAYDDNGLSAPTGTPPDPGVDPAALAKESGYTAGWAAGQTVGLSTRAAKPPVDPTSVANPFEPDPDAAVVDPADSGDADHTAAVPTGDDVVWEHEGNRLLMREGGGFTLDTRNAGRIDFQAAADGVRISSGASVMNVSPAGVTFANGGAAAQETIRGTRLIEWLQTQASFQTAMGPSGPLAQPAPTDLKTDKVKVT